MVTASERNTQYFPDTPTSEELGYTSPSGKGGTFTGFVTRAGVDPQIIAILESTIKEILETDEIVETFKNLGVEPTFMSSEDFGSRLLSDYERNTESLKAMGLIK